MPRLVKNGDLAQDEAMVHPSSSGRRVARGLLPLTAALLPLALGGCEPSEPDPALIKTIDEQQVRIFELEKSLAEARRERRNLDARWQHTFVTNRSAYEKRIEDLETDLQLRNQQIADLQTNVRRLEKTLRAEREPPAPPTPAKIFPELTTLSGPFQVSEPDTGEAARTVRVFDIAGRVTPVGTRTQPVPVLTDESYRDSFGNKKFRISYEDTIVTQYQYEVTYSVENPTDETRTVFVRAGMMTRTHALEAGHSLTNQTIQAARGSGLLITDGNRRRIYPVSFD